MARRLTQESIARLAAPAQGKRTHVASGLHPNLALRLYASGSKSWVYRKTIDGQKVRVVLGPYAPDGDDLFEQPGAALSIAGALDAVSVLERRRLRGRPLIEQPNSRPRAERAASTGTGHTFCELVELYLARKAAKGKASIEHDRAIVRLYLRPDGCPEGSPRHRLWHSDLANVEVSDLVTTYDGARRGIKRKLAIILRQAFESARQLGWYERPNPIVTVGEDDDTKDGLFILPREEPHDAVLSPLQWDRVLDELEMAPHREDNERGYLAPWIATALKLLMATGLRRKEILQARWSDLGKTRSGVPYLRVRAHKNSKKRRRAGGDGSKKVMLLPSTVQILDAWRHEVEPASSDFICQTDKGRCINGDYLSACWAKMLRRMGINAPHMSRRWRVTVHSIRHTVCTRAAEQGVELAVLAKMLGSSAATLAKYYSKAGEELELDTLASDSGHLVALFGRQEAWPRSDSQTPSIANLHLDDL